MSILWFRLFTYLNRLNVSSIHYFDYTWVETNGILGIKKVICYEKVT